MYYVYSIDTLRLLTTCLGQSALAEFLDVHINTARRAISSKVYQGYVISTTLLTTDQVQLIVQSALTAVSTRSPKKIYIYDADQSRLLHIYKSVNAFMKVSGLSGSRVGELALSSSL